MDIGSIWDGWKYNALGTRFESGDRYCALGWIDKRFSVYLVDQWNDESNKHVIATHMGRLDDQIVRRVGAVADYIRQKFPNRADPYNYGGDTSSSNDLSVIAAASNLELLSPDDFRRIDVELNGVYTPSQEPVRV